MTDKITIYSSAAVKGLNIDSLSNKAQIMLKRIPNYS